MPRSTDPHSLVRITLKSDEGTDPVPVFIFRPPTMLKERSLGTLFDRIVSAGNPESLFDVLHDELTDGLVGWENMGVEFTPEALGSVINTSEGMELAASLLAAGRLSGDEKKSSESPD